MEQNTEINLDQQFTFSPKAKKNLVILGAVAFVLIGIGILQFVLGGGHHGAEGGHGDAHGGATWFKALLVDLWVNNIFFTGIAVIGVFFVAVQYIATAGWVVAFIRVPLAFGSFLVVSIVLMLAVFFIGSHDIFHWTHASLYDANSPEYDPIIAGKAGFLNLPFYIFRMILFFGIWISFFLWIRKMSFKEDTLGGTKMYRKLIRVSVVFIIFFAVSSSIAAWDWVMSIDTHWFSTMFGWYVFASWFVSGLSAITLALILLRQAGYISFLREDHLHDMGKYIFAFSIFWTYIWFSQFLLIYYSNLPEESIYFLERLTSDYYFKYLVLILLSNFIFPFLVLMARDSKRKIPILKIVCIAVLFGHWLDFYLMIAPATLKQSGNFGFLEIGTVALYIALFLFVVLSSLSKKKLIPKNHPMLQECLQHHT